MARASVDELVRGCEKWFMDIAIDAGVDRITLYRWRCDDHMHPGNVPWFAKACDLTARQEKVLQDRMDDQERARSRDRVLARRERTGR